MAALARERGVRTWIVGGALRDLLLGHPAPEVDVAVESGAEPLARRLEEGGFGRAVLLSAESPRVVRVAGPRELDLADLEGGSIEADLARRDFTVNALAIEIGTARWSDPFGGAGDLARRRLRLVRPSNALEDPLRVPRAARFRATHGLRADAETTRACRRAAPHVASVAPERGRVELVKLLEAPLAADALRWAHRVGALAPWLGVSRARAGRIARALGRLDAPALARGTSEERGRLRLTLLARYAGFDPARARAWLAGRRFSKTESAGVSRLLALVDQAAAARPGRESWEWIRDAGSDWRAALTLLAVVSPRNGNARRLDRLAARPRPRWTVGGKDLLEWTVLEPGPLIGRLLEELELEILQGNVRTRSQARKWARDRTRSGSGVGRRL